MFVDIMAICRGARRSIRLWICLSCTSRATFVPQADKPIQVNDSHVAGPVLSMLHHPAPRLVLISALGFGCCVSSFAYRRQKDDPFQVVVFALLVGTVATVAYGVGASSNLILLGYMPFATCAAMILSLCVHTVFRWSRSQEGGTIESQEKLQLL
jgi:hypothetical protein